MSTIHDALDSMRDNQAWYIGHHLATCECATPEAREFVALLADSCRTDREIAPHVKGRD